MDETVHALVYGDESAEGEDPLHLALDDGADGVLLGGEVVGLLLELLVTEGDPALLAVETEHDEVVSLADGEHFGRIGDLVPAQLRDVRQAIKALDADEGAEFRETLDLAFDDIVDMDIVPEGVFLFLLLALEHHALGSEQVAGTLCGLLLGGSLFGFRTFLGAVLGALGHEREAEDLVLVSLEVAHITHPYLGSGHKHRVLPHPAAQSTLGDFGHLESEHFGRESLLCHLVLGAHEVDLFLGEGDILLVDGSDDRLDGVAGFVVRRIVISVCGGVCLIDEAVLLAADGNIDTGLVSLDDGALHALADAVIHKPQTRGTRRRENIFHGRDLPFLFGLVCRGVRRLRGLIVFRKRCLFVRYGLFCRDDFDGIVLSSFTHKLCNLPYQPRGRRRTRHDG